MNNKGLFLLSDIKPLAEISVSSDTIENYFALSLQD
jgi:hypothetical protein